MKYTSHFRRTVLVLASIMAFSMASCERLNDIENRLDTLETSVIDLSSTVKALQDAYDHGKIIKSVVPLEDVEEKGWKIIFSDDSEISVINGRDGKDGEDGENGITPLLKVDQGGYWSVSYDNGNTYSSVLNADGDKIEATGEEGLSVRIVDKDGKYVIQTYKASDPEIVIGETATPYTADITRIITSIEQNDRTHETTIILADGRKFSFGATYITPTSIALLSVNPVYLTMGTQAGVEFRVNPSNAKFKLDGEDCQIELDRTGTVTRSSYVTVPENYRLVRIEQVYDGDTNEMKEGQYRAIIEDTRKSSEYDEMAALVLNVKDASGNDIQISSSAFEVIGRFDDSIRTGLPIVVVNTPNSEKIKSKENWMEGATMTILDKNLEIAYQGTMSIKGRGNSTWGYPKKPYALKLDKKAEILGMPKHKRWCLLANWMDRTMLRNAVTFEISRKTGLDWTPRGQFAELVLNGKHLGNYYLCEQIKVDKERVNIAELDPEATSGDAITGGYIFELDKYYDEVYKFRPARSKMPWMFKDPDEVNQAQFDYVKNYVEEMEEALYDEEKFKNREFVNYMDLESFADWWFINELAMNSEASWPKSVYVNKDKNGKIKAGPVWDFDWGTYTPEGASHFRGKTYLCYPLLFADKEFVRIVKERWAAFKPAFESDIPVFIEEQKEILRESDKINSAMWPISGSKPNGDEDMSYEDAVARMKKSFTDKLKWLDKKIQAM